MRAWKAALIARWKAQSEMAMQQRLALWRFESLQTELKILRPNQALDLRHILPLDKPREGITALVIARLSRRRTRPLIASRQHLAAAHARHLFYHLRYLAQHEGEERRPVGGHLQRLQPLDACIFRTAQKAATHNQQHHGDGRAQQ